MDFTKTLSSSPKILILGAGITGSALVEFLKKQDTELHLFDEKLTSYESIKVWNQLDESFKKLKFDLILKSPGIKPTHPVQEYLVKLNFPLFSEIEFAKFFFKGKIIGITGTDGKSTTTALTSHFVKSYFPKSKMGGNIGLPFVSFCTEDLDYAILELSSYQLDDSNFLNLNSSAF
jgi:UDP-N-acetylmuramoylalanine--D-glutamate ligase